MRLRDFINELLRLEAKDPKNKDLEVFYRHGASGDCGLLSSAHVSDSVNECGPFLEDEGIEGPYYISIYAGN